jgi:hypothetical protein
MLHFAKWSNEGASILTINPCAVRDRYCKGLEVEAILRLSSDYVGTPKELPFICSIPGG